MIRNFLYEVCGAAGDWTMGDYKETAIRQIREKVGDGKVLLALSGGAVAAFGATKGVLTAELLRRLYGVDAALLDTAYGPSIVPKGGEDRVPLDG